MKRDRRYDYRHLGLLLAMLAVTWLAARSATAATAVLEYDAQNPPAAGIELQVTLKTGNLSDLYGVAIDLLYDPQYMTVEDADPASAGIQPKVSEGTVLNGGGASTTILRAALENGQEGRLVLGLTRSGQNPGVAIDQSTILFTVHFRPLKAGSTSIVFANQALLDSTNAKIAADAWDTLALAIAATRTILVATSGQGAVTPTGAVAVRDGGSQLFTLLPDPGFVVADLKIDSVSQGALTTHTFTNVTADHTLQAIFRRLPGDLDGDTLVTLRDAIVASRITAYLPATITVFLDAEINRDNRIGAAELVYILQKVGGLR
ncbi:MAG: cohesin domain-containing protein [Thermodesulfobacteriota bacterium]